MCGVCDTNPVNLDKGKRAYSQEFRRDVPGYENYLELFDRESPDGVFIVTPNDTHRDIVVEAAKRGIDVLCEKPMEVSLERCDEMTASAEAAGIVLAFGMQMHYRARYHRIRELIEEGVIGAPVMTWCIEFRQPFAETKNWVWDPRRSGGTIVEKNCHHYDLLDLWVQSKPSTVYASGNIMKHKRPYGYPSSIVDNAYVINDYESGARGMVEISFFMEDVLGRKMGVQGTEGRIWITKKDGEVIHVLLKNGKRHDFEVPGEIRGGLYQDFLDCMKSRTNPLVTGARARASLLVPMAAERSIAEGRIVHVSELECDRAVLAGS